MTPEFWTSIRLGKLSSLITSGSRDWAQYYADSGALFIRMTNLARDGIRLKLEDIKYVNVESDSSDGKRTKLEKKDILISITAELGKIGYVGEDLGLAFINQHTALVRLNTEKADPKFIAYLLSSPSQNRLIQRLNDAGAKAGLNLSTIKNIILTIPQLAEQSKIAQILSTWDNAIETVEALIEKNKLQKKALMQQLLMGGKRLTGFNDEAWKMVPIAKMGQIVSGGTPDTTKQAYWNGNVLWTTPTDITALATRHIDDTKRKITAEGVKNSSATLLPKDSLLVCTRATIGYMAIAKNEITTNQGFKSLVPNSNHDVDFLYYLFSYFKHRFIRMACGSTFLEISKKDFSKLAFDVPGIKNQQAIATVLSDLDAVITIYQRKLNCLQQEKKALMQQLLTGKRCVKLDEPATTEALLEGIA